MMYCTVVFVTCVWPKLPLGLRLLCVRGTPVPLFQPCRTRYSIRVQKNKIYIIINNMWMSVTKPYIMYVDYISKICIYYLLWNNNFRVDEYIISIQFLNYLISFRSSQEICFWTLWSKYVWYDVNWHYILIVIILFDINMNNFIEKTYNMINFR